MPALTKWVPRGIIGIAVVHLGYGLVVPNMAKALGEIVDDGIVNTVDGHPARESWSWFMLTGLTWLGVGEMARRTVRETGQLPPHLGGWLLAVATPLTVLMPVSGGWLIAAVGALALRAARQERPHAIAGAKQESAQIGA